MKRPGREPHKDALTELAKAARDKTPVSGWTHNFYRYPARFSPNFAAAAIRLFSQPGDIVLDPYMGGGTTVVEAVAAGRHAVGNDLNSLATFITRVKISRLTSEDVKAIKRWGKFKVPSLNYRLDRDDLVDHVHEVKSKNLTLPKARFIKKAIAAALASIESLPTIRSRRFAKCIVLRTSQWALDGKERHTPLAAFRNRLSEMTIEMLGAASEFSAATRKSTGRATLLHGDAAELHRAKVFSENGCKASLVVTSPPYPGVHVLYHRWQVDGRRETPAPYWIAGCNDGQGAAFYNFGDRREAASDKYFSTSLATLKSVRKVMHYKGIMVQMIAFNRPEEQLPRYLTNMEEAGFTEACRSGDERIWRQVPGRKWHARQKGRTNSSNEVVLVHRAV